MIYSVVAVEAGGGIGFNGSMPWPSLKEDMQWFKQLTTGHVVIMGSTTWKGFAKPLTNRINVVISKNPHASADHAFVDPCDAIKSCLLLYPDRKIFIIGGQALYDSTMHLISKFYVTEIADNYQCDKFFNLLYVKENFIGYTLSSHNETLLTSAFTIKEYSK
jgi:dihydrofolate reductase